MTTTSILLIAVVVECLLLLLLSLLKKLTKPAFLVISVLTVLGCAGIWFFSSREKTTEAEIDGRSRVYMAARLIEEEHHDKSLEVLSDVSDESGQQYNIRAVRALAYNLNGAFQTLEYYLSSGSHNELEQIVLDASQKREQVDAAGQEKILSAALAAVQATEPETQRWETEMKVRFMGFVPAGGELGEIGDTTALIKLAVTENRYQDAYNLAAAAAEKGDLRAAVLVSEMYAGNFQKIRLADADSEYALLWQQAADLRSDLNTASLALVGEDVSDEQRNEYALAEARYELAMTELHTESVKRAVKYLNSFDVSDSPDQLGYQLQMAHLFFLETQVDEAKKIITDIFTSENLNDSQWLGQECAMFREACIRYLSDQTATEYDMLFDRMMQSLYQGVVEADSNAAFKEFVMSCMKELFGGIVIRTVDASEFPVITADLTATDPNLEISTQTVLLSDTGKAIDDFSVTVNEVKDLSISLVLDRSGSMEGWNLAEAKQAIRHCISSMDEGIAFSLVTFNHTASLACALTDSSYLVMSMVDPVNANGGTNIVSGLTIAIDSLQQAKGERVIILLSDGMDSNESKARIDNVTAEAATRNITTYTIGLEGCDEEYLRKIAERTGGQFVMVSDPTQLEKTYQDIQNAILNSYFLNYQADGDEENRNIHILMNNSFAEARKDYLVSDQESYTSYYVNGLQESDYYRQIGGTDTGRD